MNNWLSKLAFIILASFALSEVSIANITAKTGTSSSWKFRVMLDDTPIGYHRVKINREQNSKSVHTQANFDVRILFIPVYSYEHETRERWVDNCLVDISSTTDDNGEDYFINSMQHKQQHNVATRAGPP